jgi:hypothetical protein
MAIDFGKLVAKEREKRANGTPAPQENKAEVVDDAPVTALGQTTVDAPTTPLSPSPASSSPQQQETRKLSNNPTEAGSVVEYPGLLDLRDKIYSLDKALLDKHPAMDSLLQTIHRNLQKDPELVHILKAEERAIIFAGLKKKTETVIVDETVKSANSGKGRGLKNIGLEDL